MATVSPSFFQIFRYFTLIAAFVGAIGACFVLGDPIVGLITVGVWGLLVAVAIGLRLGAFRKSWYSALETAWLVLVAFCGLLIVVDMLLCGNGVGGGVCSPLFLIDPDPSELSSLTYSIVIITLPLSALCFPWGIPLFYGWVHLLPTLMSLLNLPMMSLNSLEGRILLLFPTILMIPLGYWTWFHFIPNVCRRFWKAIRIEEAYSKSASLVAQGYDRCAHGLKRGIERVKASRTKKEVEETPDT